MNGTKATSSATGAQKDIVGISARFQMHAKGTHAPMSLSSFSADPPTGALKVTSAGGIGRGGIGQVVASGSS